MTLMAADTSSGAGGGGRRSSIKAGLTPKRPGRHVANNEYGAFVRPVLRPTCRSISTKPCSI